MVDSIVLINKSFNNQNMVTELQINQNNRKYVLDYIDWGAIQSTRKTYKFINQIGVYVTGTTLESRDIAITGWVVADTYAQMKERKRFLNNFVNPLQQLTLVYNDYSIDGIPDTTIKYGSDYKDNNEVVCKFVIDLFCPDPLFYTSQPKQASIADWLPKFHFPLVIPQNDGIIMGLRSPSVIITVNNPGTIETGMTVIFHARGTIVDPYLININTQKQIKFEHTMEPGETLEVTTYVNRKAAKKISGGVTTNAFNYLDFENNEFIQLAPGDNYLRYGASSGISNLEIKIEYRPQYQEVQE